MIVLVASLVHMFTNPIAMLAMKRTSHRLLDACGFCGSLYTRKHMHDDLGAKTASWGLDKATPYLVRT
jgi:hypothetical protein